jgi:hypothetical protein
VVLQVICTIEILPTEFAFEEIFFRMCSLMSFEMFLSSKSSVAAFPRALLGWRFCAIDVGEQVLSDGSHSIFSSSFLGESSLKSFFAIR